MGEKKRKREKPPFTQNNNIPLQQRRLTLSQAALEGGEDDHQISTLNSIILCLRERKGKEGGGGEREREKGKELQPLTWFQLSETQMFVSQMLLK